MYVDVIGNIGESKFLTHITRIWEMFHHDSDGAAQVQVIVWAFQVCNSWRTTQVLIPAILLLCMEYTKRLKKPICDSDSYPKGRYLQICWSCRPCAYVIESSLKLVPQVFFGIQIQTDGRPGHGCDVVLLEEIPGDSGRLGWTLSC